MRLKLYWFTLRGLPVTFHMRTDFRVVWRGIYGVSVTAGARSWFVGLVESTDKEAA